MLAHLARRRLGATAAAWQVGRSLSTSAVLSRGAAFDLSDDSWEGRRSGANLGGFASFGRPMKGRTAKQPKAVEEEDDLPGRPMKGKRGRQSMLKAREATKPRTPGPKDWSRREAPKPGPEKGKPQQLDEKVAVKPKQAKPKTIKPRQVTIPLPQFITVSDLAKVLDVKMRTLQRIMVQAGHSDTRPDMMLAFADAELLAMEFNVIVTPLSTSSADFDIFPRPPPADLQSLPLRPPVVAIMGHVDHGKTTLLDKLRSASVAAGEAGGITQHVGAFSVEVKGMSAESDRRAITFLDTPGHAAFTQMRSRGAKVTDIVVLVVAADDGVMPQTKEVINMVREVQEEEGAKGASSGGLQLLVAISKIDRSDADPAKVKGQLMGENVVLEEFGGDVPCIEISGKTGEGLDALQDNLVVISELNELRAEQDGPAEGYVIESRVEKGFGNTATVLVKRGTLKVGDYCVAGTSWCKVRRLMDSSGTIAISQGTPGEALLITGWRELPKAGEMVLGVVDSTDGLDAEELVKKCVDTRKRVEERRRLVRDVEAINEGRREEAEEREKIERQAAEVRRLQREARLRGEEYNPDMAAELAASRQSETLSRSKSDVHELRLIVKADVSGTVEAVVGAISGIGNNEVRVKIISSGVGEPTDGDLDMAKAVQAHILGFNLTASRSLQSEAQRLSPPVQIHCDDVIYRLMTYVTEQCAALLPPLLETRVVGEASVQQVFPINVSGRTMRNVAGCRVTNGTINKNQMVRVLRTIKGQAKEGDGIKIDNAGRQILYEGRLDSLKQIKKEVDEMRKGSECGMSFDDGFQDLVVGDLVQCYYIEKVPRTL